MKKSRQTRAAPKDVSCPVGESSCEWIDEVTRLRVQVDELSQLVATDPLTGLFNLRHFKQAMQAEMDRSKRSSIPTSLVMAEVDHFETLNDEHGREAGNQVLKRIADICRGEVRTTDLVCRYGGEVFAIVFPETHLNLAVKVADRIRQEIADTPIELDHGEVKVTVSMGASVYVKTSVIDVVEFIDSVDKFLFEAKQSGRNCICHIDYAELRSVTEIGAPGRILRIARD